MFSLSLAPASFYPGKTITSHDWREGDGKVSRMIRTDVALDNTVVVTDSGFSWGDTSMSISIKYSVEREQALMSWLVAWPILIICRFDGIFRAVLQSVQQTLGRLVLKLAVIERT